MLPPPKHRLSLLVRLVVVLLVLLEIVLAIIVVLLGLADRLVLRKLLAHALVVGRVVGREEPLCEVELDERGVDRLEGGCRVLVPRDLVAGERHHPLHRGLGGGKRLPVRVARLLARVVVEEQAHRVIPGDVLEIPCDPAQHVDRRRVSACGHVAPQPGDEGVRVELAVFPRVLDLVELVVHRVVRRLAEVGRLAPRRLALLRRRPHEELAL
mmetsp:Transcript_41550/g.99878  ORF Transcript_41550/g.99878 Transcript_41550/m.99878 type:complete len:212 (-) Transcript_41550:569-1204(-)